MADLDRLRTALKNAHQAGDEAAARKLATEIRRQQTSAREPTVGLGADVARSIPSGLKRGTEALVGTAEDTGLVGSAVIGKLASWLGFDPTASRTAGEGVSRAIGSGLNPIGGVSKIVRDVGGPDLTRLYAPSSESAREDIEAAVPAAASINYAPQTRLGRFAHTGMEFLPAAVAGPMGWRNIARRGAEELATGLVSEGAGQLTEGSGLEPWARVGAGLGGAATMSSLVRKAPTPQAQTMLAEGVPLTAGQATGSPRLKFAESELGGGATQALIDRQREAFTANRMAQIGAPAGSLATPETMARELDRIGKQFDAVAQAAGDVPLRAADQSAIVNAVARYQDLVGPGMQAGIVERTMNDIGALAPAGTITGEQYGVLRSQLGDAIRSADPATSDALRTIQNALDDAVERHLATATPDMAGNLKNARDQYRLFLDLERAVANGPAAVVGEGLITPASLRGGVKGVEGNRRLVTGQSEFAEPANAGSVAMSPVPESGTSARTATRVAAGLGAYGEPLAAAASIIGPGIAGRALMSRPVQNLLMSAPENARAALTAIIAANQTRKQGGEGWQP